MNFLIVDTYYPKFLNSFYRQVETNDLSYRDQLKKLSLQCFGIADFYSSNLKTLGHDVQDVILNDNLLQKKWAQEKEVSVNWHPIRSYLQSLPLMYRVLKQPKWIQEVVLFQLHYYKPDILYVHNLSMLNPETLKEAKSCVKLIVGQIACPPPPENYLMNYDLILTSFPHYVDRFRKLGINSEYMALGFESTLQKKIEIPKRKTFDTSFIGSYSHNHKKGTKLLESVAKTTKIDFWGQGINSLSPFSTIRKHYHGEAWGLEMYKILAQSKIVINRHINAAENYANNMRLYETTGMGALLVTDMKDNLNDLFEVGKEVVAYENEKDLIEKIQYYLAHDDEREKIAKAGQRRTLKNHTYKIRMKELENILLKYL